jgi:hypothetical protein
MVKSLGSVWSVEGIITLKVSIVTSAENGEIQRLEEHETGRTFLHMEYQ